MNEEEICRHEFGYINSPPLGDNGYDITSCVKCGRSFIFYQKDKYNMTCIDCATREEYDYETGALIINGNK